MPGPPKTCGLIAAACFYAVRAAAAIVVAGATMSAAAWADGPAVTISFNGPETKWQLLDDRRLAHIGSHECVREGARNSEGAERIVVAAASGRSTSFACEVGRMPLLDEFSARLWVKASRPGVQLAARIVLPRSVDPQTGQPLATIVRGPLTQQAGHWQQLELAGVDKLLADQVRVLRAARMGAVDANEPYVDAIVLSVPGNPHGTEIVTDELEVDGVVIEGVAIDGGNGMPRRGGTTPTIPQNSSGTLTAGRAANDLRLAANTRGVGRQIPGVGSSAAGRSTPPVQMQGANLLVDGKPFAPRAIQWNGEPLSFLAERGFNAVELRDPPSEQQLAEAERNDLWIVCPPPADATAEPRSSFKTASEGGQAQFAPRTPQIQPVPSGFERVLAWRLDDPAAEDSAAHFRNWADRIRARDDLPPRPMLIAPQHEWSALGDVAWPICCWLEIRRRRC
jgi:hypothetical protein